MTLPELRPTVGKKGKNRLPDGSEHRFEVVGEIRRTQSDLPSKILILQKVRFEDGAEELRLGYYIIGKKPGMVGRWVWGQFATFLPAEDLAAIVEEARLGNGSRQAGYLPAKERNKVIRFALFQEHQGSQ